MVQKKKELYHEGLEEYPRATVFIENLLFVLWLGVGAFLCWTFLPLIAWIYLGFGVTMMLFVMRIAVCKNCYYHNKRCHTGWGKLSALYCRHGEITNFCRGVAGALIPAFYGSIALVPMVLGVIAMVKQFSVVKLSAFIVFLFIITMSSVILRKKSCDTCKMKLICPGSATK
ncbi:hypothetical protein KKF84_08975 [Myxococcota bacterium]|nr:hypothetical protein [Myxococcota bacterium]